VNVKPSLKKSILVLQSFRLQWDGLFDFELMAARYGRFLQSAQQR